MHDTFYFTDIHGCLNLFHTMRDWCYKQDPECTIIYGGDACDRGEHGYEIMNTLLADPQILYLKGNHEDLFVKAARELIGYYACNDELYTAFHNCHDEKTASRLIRDGGAYDVSLHCYNGGFPTLCDWILDGAEDEFVDKIDELPVTFSYGGIDFCHAGGTYQAFKQINEAEYFNTVKNSDAEKLCIWDRTYLNEFWENPNSLCIFGHTPTCFLKDHFIKVPRSCTDDNMIPVMWKNKIDMDTGAFFTGQSFVLNINTLTAFGFKGKYDNNIQDYQNIKLTNKINMKEVY